VKQEKIYLKNLKCLNRTQWAWEKYPSYGHLFSTPRNIGSCMILYENYLHVFVKSFENTGIIPIFWNEFGGGGIWSTQITSKTHTGFPADYNPRIIYSYGQTAAAKIVEFSELNVFVNLSDTEMVYWDQVGNSRYYS
jgi:hypothetical protein